MKGGIRRLLEELGEIRSNPHVIGPQHPRFKEWVGGVRQILSARNGREDLARFERLRVASVGREMWRSGELTPAETRRLERELEEVEALLSEPEAPASRPSPPAAAEEPTFVYKDATEPVPQDASPKMQEEQAVNRKSDGPEPSATPQTGNFKAMEVLLADLGDELKRPDGDLGKIQKMMDDLVGLKKTGDLADSLLSVTEDPAAPWEVVRGLMAQLWAFNREVLIDTLPALLKKG
jgi:hypothetical protein